MVVLAVLSVDGCERDDSKPSPTYQHGYNAGRSDQVKRLIKQGELPIKACDDSLRADKSAQGYSLDDEAVYKQACLDALRAEGISPDAGF
ncbi:hypothetical protein MSTO_24770 [Mycobacterium stomatepiae]|uniref:Uncharacterized protein n=2 Tax=Mycobacterium stomatepiae TaxID=470076 RepID=A0A7I7Q860_9MYCO|nr:hypothetical protein MSTO_24770 [Mycobacterium stomatepiae]